MTAQTVDGPPILIGYPYEIEVDFSTAAALFPAGATFEAHLRVRRGGHLVTRLTSAANEIVRMNDRLIALRIPPAKTALLQSGAIMLDIARTDVDPATHLRFTMTIPVVQPLTEVEELTP